MKTILLYGKLADLFGKRHRLDVKTPGEALRALMFLFPKFQAEFEPEYWAVVKTKNDGDSPEPVIDKTVNYSFGKADTLHIMPKSAVTGLETILIVGGLLLVAAAVAVSMFAPLPMAPNADDREREESASGIADRPINTIAQGHAAAVIYGEVITGSNVVSSGVQVSDIQGSYYNHGNYGGGGSGGGSSWRTQWGQDIHLSKGGKGGGGQARSAQEDPNTLRSNAVVRTLEVIGVGPCVGLVDGLKSVFIDGTPVENADGSHNFPGFQIEVRNGEESQGHVPGFPSQEGVVQKNLEVSQAGGPLIHTITDPNVDSAKVAIGIPSLYKQNLENGDLEFHNVKIDIEVQANGGGFTSIFDTAAKGLFDGKCTSRYQREYGVNLPVGGAPWDIRVSRVSGDTPEASKQDDTFLDFVTEQTDIKLNWPGIAHVGIAVDMLKFGQRIPTRSYRWKGLIVSVPTNFDPETREYATSGAGTQNGVWDGTFKQAYTDDPAWCLYDLMTNTFYGAGILTQGKVDKWAFYAASVYCNEEVPDGSGGMEPRYRISAIIRSREQAYTLFNQLAAVFRAGVYWTTEGLSLIQDRPVADEVKKVIVPANTGQRNIVYEQLGSEDRFSAVIVWWNNIDDEYSLTAHLESDNEAAVVVGFEFDEFTALGAATEGQAIRAARWRIDNQNNRRRRARIPVGPDQKLRQPGEVIKVHDERYTDGAFGGRVFSVDGTSITLDREITLDPARAYTMTAILPGGDPETVSVVSDSVVDGRSVISVALEFSSPPVIDGVWAIESDLVKMLEFRIMNIEEDADGMGATLHCEAYDPNAFARVEGGVFSNPVTFPSPPSGQLDPVPENTISILEYYTIDGNSSVPSLRVSWASSPDPRAVRYEAQIKLPGSEGFASMVGDEELSRSIVPITPGDAEVRVRPIAGTGDAGPWRLAAFTLVAQTPTLPTIINPIVSWDDEALQTWIRWDDPVDVRPLRYEVFKGDPANIAAAELIGQSEKREQIVTEQGQYFVRTCYMDERSEPVAVNVSTSELPNPQWSRVDGRPTDLGGLDAQAAADIAEALTGVSDLEATYGETAAAAASAASAAASESAAAAHETNAETAQTLAETAQAAAETAEQSAQEFSEIAVRVTRDEIFPGSFENADQYFTHQVGGLADVVADVTDLAGITAIDDPVEGPGVRVQSENWVAVKGLVPVKVGDVIRQTTRYKMVTAPTNGATIYGSLRLVDGAGVQIGTLGNQFPTLVEGVVDEFVQEYTVSQSNWDSGTRYVRGAVLSNHIAGVASGDGTFEYYLLEVRNVTSEANAAASASASASSATSAAASETAASQSASAASTSEINAATSESNAASSETSAATSETNAAGSASAAATSETNAAQSETNAGASATAASTSASTAQTEATDAATSASAAATSAVEASTSADEASSDASAAAASAATASASETAAGQSATAAQTAEVNANTSYQKAEGVISNSLIPGGQFFGDPQLTASSTVGHWDIVDDANEGRVLRLYDSIENGNRALYCRTFKVVPGNRVKIGFRGKINDAAGPQGFYLRLQYSADFHQPIDSTNRDGLTDFINGNEAVLTEMYADYEYEHTLNASAEWVNVALLNWNQADRDIDISQVWLYDIEESHQAGISASDASVSAGSAATSESNAAGSASAAAASETVAANASNSAASSAAAAATSESNAAASETSAGSYAGSAQTSATEAATSEANASTSETNAAASATAAGTSESGAASSAAAASTSETNASTSASNASVSETNAATSATNASSSESTAASLVEVAAKIQASAINPNSTFSEYPASGGIPPDWQQWSSGGTGTNEPGLISSNAYRLAGIAGANTGLQKQGVEVKENGWYVLEADVVLNGGTFDGAALHVSWRTSGNAGNGTSTIFLKTNPDETNSVPGAGIVGERYKFTKIVQAPAGSDSIYLYLMSHWTDGVGGVAVANDITWHRASIRAANVLEIDAGRVVDIEADVSINASAIASTEGRLVAHWSVETSVPGADAFIQARADQGGYGNNPASTVAIGADQFEIFNNVEGAWKTAMKVAGGNLEVQGNIAAGGSIGIGSTANYWPLALQNKEYYESDGASIDFGLDIGSYEVDFFTDGLDPLAANEVYALSAISQTGTGFTAELKITTPGATSSVTENTNATTPAGPDQMLAKVDADVAYNGIYKYYASGTIDINYQGQEYFVINPPEFEAFYHDGSAWVSAGTFSINYWNVGISPNHGSGVQSYSFNALVSTESFTGVRTHATDGCFGLSFVSGSGSLTDLTKVEFTKQTQSSTRSATPGGELGKIVVRPINTTS